MDPPVRAATPGSILRDIAVVRAAGELVPFPVARYFSRHRYAEHSVLATLTIRCRRTLSAVSRRPVWLPAAAARPTVCVMTEGKESRPACGACGDPAQRRDPLRDRPLCEECYAEIVHGRIDTRPIHFTGGRSERALGSDLRFHGSGHG